jgi:transcriptional regulator with XRE-family HTH domain
MAREKPDPVDVHVGANIRLFRSAKGLSQTAVGDALGVTFQQIQKHERGANRVGPARLTKLSKLLGVPVSRFFEDHEGAMPSGTSKVVDALLSQQFSMRLLKAFAALRNARTRLAVLHMIEALSEEKRG